MHSPDFLEDWLRLAYRFRLTTPADDEVLEEQVLDACTEERNDSLARCVHDGLPFDVETGVEDHFASRRPADGLEKRMEFAVARGGYGL